MKISEQTLFTSLHFVRQRFALVALFSISSLCGCFFSSTSSYSFVSFDWTKSANWIFTWKNVSLSRQNETIFYLIGWQKHINRSTLFALYKSYIRRCKRQRKICQLPRNFSMELENRNLYASTAEEMETCVLYRSNFMKRHSSLVCKW